ncbi:MAG: phosphoribosyltransferase [Candidatus Kerfeldbacteria bacterium]|nr:phosphoribosyltransferase [Candidatus Kerfeldbacteria bacterium]
MKELFLTYDDIHRLCQKVAKEITVDSWKPDCIVAIAGGGLIPARILRLFLEVPIYVISVRRYDDTKLVSQVPQIMQWFDDPVQQVDGKRILLVDEVDDTRVTLAFCAKKVLAENPASLRIAVLTQKQKPKDAELPEDVEKVYAAKIIDDLWVNHPWESQDIEKHNAGIRT